MANNNIIDKAAVLNRLYGMDGGVYKKAVQKGVVTEDELVSRYASRLAERGTRFTNQDTPPRIREFFNAYPEYGHLINQAPPARRKDLYETIISRAAQKIPSLREEVISERMKTTKGMDIDEQTALTRGIARSTYEVDKAVEMVKGAGAQDIKDFISNKPVDTKPFSSDDPMASKVGKAATEALTGTVKDILTFQQVRHPVETVKRGYKRAMAVTSPIYDEASKLASWLVGDDRREKVAEWADRETAEAATGVAQIQQVQEKFGSSSKNMIDYLNKSGWDRAFHAMAHPDVAFQLAAESQAAQWPMLPLMAATGFMSSPAPFALASALSAYEVEKWAQFNEMAVNSMDDPGDPDEWEALFRDKNKRQEFMRISEQKGIPIGMMAALATLAGRSLGVSQFSKQAAKEGLPSAIKTNMNVIMRRGADTFGKGNFIDVLSLEGAQMMADATGEVLGQLWATGKIDPDSVTDELIAGSLSQAKNITFGQLAEGEEGRTGRQREKVLDKAMAQVDVEGAQEAGRNIEGETPEVTEQVADVEPDRPQSITREEATAVVGAARQAMDRSDGVSMQVSPDQNDVTISPDGSTIIIPEDTSQITQDDMKKAVAAQYVTSGELTAREQAAVLSAFSNDEGGVDADVFYSAVQNPLTDDAVLQRALQKTSDYMQAVTEGLPQTQTAKASSGIITPGEVTSNDQQAVDALKRRFKNVEVGTFPNSIEKALKELSKAFNIRVIPVEGVGTAMFDAAELKGTRYIAISTSTTEPVQALAMHEVMHKMKTDSPDAWRSVFDTLSTVLGEKDLSSFVQAKYDLYQNMGQTLEGDLARDEWVANRIQKAAKTAEFWTALVQKDPSLFKRVYTTIVNAVREIGNFLKRADLKDSLGSGWSAQQLRDISESAAEALKRYAEESGAIPDDLRNLVDEIRMEAADQGRPDPDVRYSVFNTDKMNKEQRNEAIKILKDFDLHDSSARTLKKYVKRYFSSKKGIADQGFDTFVEHTRMRRAAARDIVYRFKQVQRALKKAWGVPMRKKIPQSVFDEFGDALQGKEVQGLSEEQWGVVESAREDVDALIESLLEEYVYNGPPKHAVQNLDGLKWKGDIIPEGYFGIINHETGKLITDKDGNLVMFGDEREAEVYRSKEFGTLAETLEASIGYYLTRGYRIFGRKYTPEVEDVANFIREYAHAHPDATREEIAGVTSFLLNPDFDSPFGLFASERLTERDRAILTKRKNITDALAAMWGETKNPLAIYMDTMQKQVNLLHKVRMMRTITHEGYGEYMFDKPMVLGGIRFDREYKVPYEFLPEEGRENMSPSDSKTLYVTKEFRDFLKGEAMRKDLPWWARGWLKINGTTKSLQTIYNFKTQSRNFLGNFLVFGANGYFLRPDRAVRGLKFAAETILADISKTQSESLEAYLRMIELGVAEEGTARHEVDLYLKEMIGEIEKLGGNIESESFVSKVLQGAPRLYEYGDTFWKIAAWHNEVEIAKQYKKPQTEAEIEAIHKEAAEIVTQTFPTWSMIPDAIKSVMQFPAAAPFISFPYLIARSTYKRAQIISKDFKEGRTKLGWARAVSTAGSLAAMRLAAIASRKIFDVDDDEDKAVKRALPMWLQDSSIVYADNIENGKTKILDFSYLDPFGHINTILNGVWRGTREGGVVEGAKRGAFNFMEPIIQPEITLSVLKRMEEDYDKFLPLKENAESVISNLASAVPMAKFGQSLWRGRNPEQSSDYYGRGYDWRLETATQFGLPRYYSLDIGKRLGRKAIDFNDQKRAGSRNLNRLLFQSGKITQKEVNRAYRVYMDLLNDAYSEAAMDVASASRAGISPSTMEGQFIKYGMSKKDAINVSRMRPPDRTPPVYSNRDLDRDRRRMLRNAIRNYEEDARNEE